MKGTGLTVDLRGEVDERPPSLLGRCTGHRLDGKDRRSVDSLEPETTGWRRFTGDAGSSVQKGRGRRGWGPAWGQARGAYDGEFVRDWYGGDEVGARNGVCIDY